MKSDKLRIYLLGRIEVIDHMVNSTAPGDAQNITFFDHTLKITGSLHGYQLLGIFLCHF